MLRATASITRMIAVSAAKFVSKHPAAQVGLQPFKSLITTPVQTMPQTSSSINPTFNTTRALSNTASSMHYLSSTAFFASPAFTTVETELNPTTLEQYFAALSSAEEVKKYIASLNTSVLFTKIEVVQQGTLCKNSELVGLSNPPSNSSSVLGNLVILHPVVNTPIQKAILKQQQKMTSSKLSVFQPYSNDTECWRLNLHYDGGFFAGYLVSRHDVRDVRAVIDEQVLPRPKC